ncbi:MAG: hypothetical protein IPH78_01290 [Bacteroidetes bacterium]|nr:hypothetical protein [Bacteroidota bacterium]
MRIKKPFPFIAVLLGITGALAIAELALRASGMFKTYSEKRMGEMFQALHYNHHNIYWNYNPNDTFTLTTPEFTIGRKTNSHGFADKEFTPRTDSSEIRILTLGDSFTFGDGAPADSAYPNQLQSILRARYPTRDITVFNAGTCGSDPVFGYYTYKHLLGQLIQPDIIVQSLSAQDYMEDLVLRGGFERFTNDTTIQFTGSGFKYEWWYQHFHLARLYFTGIKGYNDFFINDELRAQKRATHIAITQNLVSRWQQALQPGQQLFFMLRPDPVEIENKRYNEYFQPIVDSITPLPTPLHLADFNQWLHQTYHIEPSQIYNIFWKQDGHHNPYGYGLMATSVADNIAPAIVALNK